MENYKKTEHFEAIAMKCTKEQFEEIKPILDKYIEDVEYTVSGFQFEIYPYVTNYSCEKQNRFNTRPIEFLHSLVEIVETWNSEIFLKACGIEKAEKTYTLTETFVKELCKEPNIKEAFVREGIIEEPKQETLEEASERFSKQGFWQCPVSFEKGAKWQQEQNKNLYSEEEVLKFTQTILMQYKFGNTNIEQIDLLKETLKQFKKK